MTYKNEVCGSVKLNKYPKHDAYLLYRARYKAKSMNHEICHSDLLIV